jgi:hypothetical protein
MTSTPKRSLEGGRVSTQQVPRPPRLLEKTVGNVVYDIYAGSRHSVKMGTAGPTRRFV